MTPPWVLSGICHNHKCSLPRLSAIIAVLCRDCKHFFIWVQEPRNPLLPALREVLLVVEPRLDRIVATKPVADTSTACYIDTGPRIADRPSDHTPIVAEFDW